MSCRDLRLWRIIAIVAIAAGGCAFHSAPTTGLRFAPPPGWRSSPGFLGFMQFWRPPNNDHEVLMLFKSPRPLRPRDVFSDARMQPTLRDAVVERRSDILICGNQPARYVQARGTSSRGDHDRVEMVLTNAAGSSYFAMYVRPLSSVPNAAAQAALREICPKR